MTIIEDEARDRAAERYPAGRSNDVTTETVRSVLRQGYQEGYLAASRRDRAWPPDGWFLFGSHVDWPGPLEFSEETTEDGMPAWERHVSPEPSEPREVFVLDGELARDDAHRDLLPLPLAFPTQEAAEAYVESNQPLWGSWSIQRMRYTEPSDTDEREWEYALKHELGWLSSRRWPTRESAQHDGPTAIVVRRTKSRTIPAGPWEVCDD